ncbi:hypothetical protein ACWPM1_05655 [Tsuneonella sp. HG249]
MTRSKQLIASVSCALLGACASASADYPSLAQRPAERAQGTFTPDAGALAPPPPVLPSADLAARLADLLRQAEATHAEFRNATPGAQRFASAAGSRGSDSWAAAEVALSDLDSIRSRVAVAMADLDALWVDATLEGGAREAIGSVRGSVEALLAEEDAILARLRGSI